MVNEYWFLDFNCMSVHPYNIAYYLVKMLATYTPGFELSFSFSKIACLKELSLSN